MAGTTAAVAAVYGAYSANESRQDAKQARRDAKKERAQADIDAATSANARLTMQKQAQRQNSLLAAPGRNTLGAG